MRGKESLRCKRQIESFLVICVLVITSIVVMLPLNTPKVKAQEVDHTWGSAAAEDGSVYDMGPGGDNIVLWDQNADHIISANYIIEAEMTLIIPPLNYESDREMEHEIWFNISGGGTRIEVEGKLITQSDINPDTKTAFMGPTSGGFWSGIYFLSGSEGTIQDTLIDSATFGVIFEPGSKLMYPGIYDSRFENILAYGLQMDGVSNYTNVEIVDFTDNLFLATSLVVTNMNLNLSNVNFYYHGTMSPCLHILNADVHADQVNFFGNPEPGNLVIIEGDSNDTILSNCVFQYVAAGDHHVRVDGSSPLLDNCTFMTPANNLSVIANEDFAGVPAHPIILNPSGGLIGFDNSTLSVTGASSIELQWYMHVYVRDPNFNPIPSAPVWVEDKYGTPAQPPSKSTDVVGWARWFKCTEFINYSASRVNFNPFTAYAENNSMIGYAIPNPVMNMTKDVTIEVPWNPTPNTPPSVSYLQLSSPGVQSGEITIEFRLSDPDPGDNGNLSAGISYSTDGSKWYIATPAAGHSNPMTNLDNDTLIFFVWDSSTDLPGIYDTSVFIRITPSDKIEQGSPGTIGPFTIDNKPPEFLSLPLVSVTNTTATIEWLVDEPANATVWYGFYETFTNETSNNSMTATQSVTLTGLQHGRLYSFIINSSDLDGNTNSSYPVNFTFETEVHIKLYKGWNMISIPPDYDDVSIDGVLATIAGQWDIVEWYDAWDHVDPWKINHTGKPYGNDLYQITPEMGIWIHMINDAVLIPDQWDPTINPLYPGWFIQLYAGWNFVGYPSAQNRDVDDALQGVPYDKVMTYDAASGQWLSYDGTSGNLARLETGRGYWIYNSQDYLWTIDYAD